jgi:hypothetical protein
MGLVAYNQEKKPAVMAGRVKHGVNVQVSKNGRRQNRARVFVQRCIRRAFDWLGRAVGLHERFIFVWVVGYAYHIGRGVRRGVPYNANNSRMYIFALVFQYAESACLAHLELTRFDVNSVGVRDYAALIGTFQSFDAETLLMQIPVYKAALPNGGINCP